MPKLSSGPEQAYFDHLRAGRFMLQRNRRTGEFIFFPRTLAPLSGSTDLEWVNASGAGTVYSTTVVRRRQEHGGDYNVALIDLADGPRMMSTVVGIEPGQVRIGMAVRARIEPGDPPVLIFDTTPGASS